MSQDRKEHIISEISKNRLGLYELLKQNEENNKDVFAIKLKTDDFRNRGLILSQASEIAKAKTEAVNSEINIRKAIEASIKLEYDLISKLDDEINDINKKDAFVDIRELSKKIVELNQKASNG